jgi:AcrR family transcriptional regulator
VAQEEQPSAIPTDPNAAGDGNGGVSRQRQRFNSTRHREILTVAARLFSEKGFRGTSMDDIARELGILKGSLYYWIESKEELLSQVLEESVVANIEESEEIAARPLPSTDRLRLLVRCHIDHWIRNPYNFNVYLSDWRWLDEESLQRYRAESGHLEGIYKRVIQDGIDCGEIDLEQQDITLVVNGILGMMNWFPRWYRPEHWATPDYIADTLGRLVVDGLATRER